MADSSGMLNFAALLSISLAICANLATIRRLVTHFVTRTHKNHMSHRRGNVPSQVRAKRPWEKSWLTR